MKSTAKRLAAGMLAALLALSLSACEPADGQRPKTAHPKRASYKRRAALRLTCATAKRGWSPIPARKETSSCPACWAARR